MEKLMKKITAAFIVCFTLAAASANADPGLSIGASAGYVTVAQSDPTFDFDGNDVGYKLFGNYMFNNYLGVEGGYVDFGAPDAGTVLGTASIEATGWNLYLVGNLPLGDAFDLFAKAGGIKWDADSFIDGINVGGDDGNDLALSGGARLNIGSLGIRAEIDWYDIADADKAWMASIGLEFRF
jgi:OOP family OmpA-OmpF porin